LHWLNADGKRAEIRNFRSFSASERKARMVRNPKTGELFSKSATIDSALKQFQAA